MGRASLAALFPHVEPDRLTQAVETLCHAGKLCTAGELFLTPQQQKAYQEQILLALKDYHTAHPLEWGMPLPELKKLVPPELVDALKITGEIQCGGTWAAAAGFSPLNTPVFKAAADKITGLYAKWDCMPQDVSQVPAIIGESREDAARVLDLLLEQGALEPLTPSLLVAQTAYQKAKDAAAEKIKSDGSITLAQFRDQLGLSRKYAAALLEHMDACGFTVKNGDLRTLSDRATWE